MQTLAQQLRELNASERSGWAVIYSNQEVTIQTISMRVAIQRPISDGENSLASHLGQDNLNPRTTLLHFLQSMGDSPSWK